MGKFSAGPWIIILSLYFTIFFLMTAAVIQASGVYTKMNVTGIAVTGVNIVQPAVITGYCQYIHKLYVPAFCNSIPDETSCMIINSTGQCYWTGTVCGPSLQIVEYRNCDSPIVVYNETICGAIKSSSGNACEWIASDTETAISNTGSYDWTNVVVTIQTMSGFGGSIGVPSGIWSSLFYIIMFWIPGFMLLWAIYMAVPWIH
jgi:hypothetical protein